MSLVIEAPETLPAAVHPPLDDAPAFTTPRSILPAPNKSLSWWQTIVHRFSQRVTPNPSVYRPSDAAIDCLAREQPFLYIKVLSG